MTMYDTLQKYRKNSAHKNKTIFADNVPLRNMCKCSSSASVTTFIPDKSQLYVFMRLQRTMKMWKTIETTNPV